MRYEVIKGSASGHGCFKYSVIDRERPVYNFEKDKIIYYECACECYEKDEAEKIATALNQPI